jgi:hypothetical protein
MIKQMMKTTTREKANIEHILKLSAEYPQEFIDFCTQHILTPPKITTGNGKALSVMLENANFYWDREVCDAFVKKFDIPTRDSIQLFNKHEQWGIKTSTERGKNYIVYPYELSNKHKMRKDFKYNGTEQEKNAEIDKIKSTIATDYVHVPNNEWQLGHKNPESEDNSNENLVLQPPIQAKYRDNYIFLDTLTKIPTPKTIIKLYQQEKCPYTKSQLLELKAFLQTITQDESDFKSESKNEFESDSKSAGGYDSKSEAKSEL